jgi:hypothetical protein
MFIVVPCFFAHIGKNTGTLKLSHRVYMAFKKATGGQILLIEEGCGLF